MSEEFLKVMDTQTHTHTELLPELLVGAKNFGVRNFFLGFKKKCCKRLLVQV